MKSVEEKISRIIEEALTPEQKGNLATAAIFAPAAGIIGYHGYNAYKDSQRFHNTPTRAENINDEYERWVNRLNNGEIDQAAYDSHLEGLNNIVQITGAQ